MNKAEITGHVEFARMFADVIGYLHGNAVEDIQRVGDAVESLAEMFYTHGAKHASESTGGVKAAKEGHDMESYLSALKVMRVWAGDEKWLDADDVISLIDRTLRKVDQEEETREREKWWSIEGAGS